MFLSRLVVMIAIFSQLIYAQEKEITQQIDDLKRIRAEIQKYKEQVQSESIREANILDVISALDHEIDLTHALLEQLKQEEQKNSTEILNVAHELKGKHFELDRLEELYKNRLINFYKYGRMKDIEILISSKSFNQVLLWIKYQKLVSDNDRRNFNNILKKKSIIEDNKDKLKNELITKRRIIEEKSEEEEKLRDTKKERGDLLVTVRQNKELYIEKLKQYETSAKEIERLISVEEKRRIALREKGIKEYSEFPQLRGNMIWPTRGKIITKFGRYTHPELKTITESIGIDIKSDLGEAVRVVGEGVVTAITWQRGRGNIIIVNHFGGYYTVYTHLSKIFVQIEDKVDAGQVIGEVGDSGSLKGPMLHFEIWKNNKVLDPSEWLG